MVTSPIYWPLHGGPELETRGRDYRVRRAWGRGPDGLDVR